MKKLLFYCTILMLTISCNKKNPSHSEKEIDEIQEDILSRDGINEVLSNFEKIKYSELPEEYKRYTDSTGNYEKELADRFYYQLEGEEIYTKIVGNFMIKDFLSEDKYYKSYLKNPTDDFKQYWLIDEEVLYMMLQLIHRLDEGGYDMYAFHIRCCHRHPTRNEEWSGAKYSQHMFGRAIDIGVNDVNKDGKETFKDKTIIYDLLQEIVGDNGGLGRYPGSMNLHFDCRGFKARWDVP